MGWPRRLGRSGAGAVLACKWWILSIAARVLTGPVSQMFANTGPTGLGGREVLVGPPSRRAGLLAPSAPLYHARYTLCGE